MFVLAEPLHVAWHKGFAADLMAAGIPEWDLFDATDPTVWEKHFKHELRPQFDFLGAKIEREKTLRNALNAGLMTPAEVDAALSEPIASPPAKHTLESLIEYWTNNANATVFKLDGLDFDDSVVRIAEQHLEKRPYHTFIFWDELRYRSDHVVFDALCSITPKDHYTIFRTRSEIVQDLKKYYDWLDWFDTHK